MLATRAGRFGGSGARQEHQSEEVVGAAAAGPGREGGAAAHGSGTSMLLCHTPG